MKVLLGVRDCFGGSGSDGGHYRSLVRSNPDIDFYFAEKAVSGQMPPNAYPVAPGVPATDDPAVSDFLGIAAAFAGQHFDVLDLPEHDPLAVYLLAALDRFGVRYDRLVLAATGLPAASDDSAALHSLLYRAADVRYGLSHVILESRTAAEGIAGHYLSPLRLGFQARATSCRPAPEPPGIVVLGSRDPVAELLWWLPRAAYREIIMDGAVPAAFAFRKLDVTTGDDLCWRSLFTARNLVIVPPGSQAIDLTALEALVSGCPLVVGRGAGTARLLADSFPGLPWLEFDPGDPQAAAADLTRLLVGYDDRRAALTGYLQTWTPRVDGRSLAAIYQSPVLRTADFRSLVAAARSRLDLILESAAPAAVRHGARDPEQQLADALPPLSEAYRLYAAVPENGAGSRALKKQILRHALTLRIDHGRILGELARLHRLDGENPDADACDLKAMRLAGADRFGRLAMVAESLRRAAMPHEAAAAEALFDDPAAAEARCAMFLDHARERCRLLTPARIERHIDGRTHPAPRVALIVSLYNAAPKMPRFLDLLRRQTMVRDGLVEVIFVDSGSPCDEWAAIEGFPECLYLRTRDRETIPQAWNRGIAASRAPYLGFLGADEALHPDALALLVAALELDPAVNWVQASAVVIQTDATGRYLDDINICERRTVDADFLVIDTAYVGHVPALYRRQLHDRFGWYDGSFRGASDTEFKLRAFPALQVRTLDRTLGEYLNYPEIRTTAGVTTGIEDLRAWTLPRSVAGIHALAGQIEPDRIFRMAEIALGHRAHHFDVPRCDIDLAVALLGALVRRAPDHPGNRLMPQTVSLLNAYRRLDFLGGNAPIVGPSPDLEPSLHDAWNAIRIATQQHRDLGQTASYVFHNDRRCLSYY
ncbi:MAG: glycosyltransferase [Azospirillaceae bacterium]|nr:glycosyltransferase [Azospirillaceae bacterium]